MAAHTLSTTVRKMTIRLVVISLPQAGGRPREERLDSLRGKALGLLMRAALSRRRPLGHHDAVHGQVPALHARLGEARYRQVRL